MTDAISIIKDEHRSMAAVLKGLISHIAEVKAGRTEPDFHLMFAMFDYIQAFPERLHHPKEDEYLFRFLRLRSVEAHAVLDELEAQHARGAELLNNLRLKLAEYRESGNCDVFEKALGDYAEFQWAHMHKEEEVVLPLAERYLTAEDWQAIDAAFRSNLDRAW
ncbi:MAG TPA: hemerythrin domain-containing protein [Candidatus Competibacteraceae bacterium]|nr:hemerythrin domain-containing protein [Candidatus Competibacteraceae bacterium]